MLYEFDMCFTNGSTDGWLMYDYHLRLKHTYMKYSAVSILNLYLEQLNSRAVHCSRVLIMNLIDGWEDSDL